MKNQLFNGDSEEVLKGLPDQLFDACVTDPPYGLGTKEPTPEEIDAYLAGDGILGTIKEGRKHCANSVAGLAVIPQSDGSHAEAREDLVTFRILVPSLTVPAGSVEFNDKGPVREEKIHHEGSVGQIDNVLVDEIDPHLCQHFNDGKFRLGERQGFAGCVKVCGCFSQLSDSTFRVLVRLENLSGGDSEPAGGVLAGGTTETRAVLTLDVRRRTGELRATEAADESDAGLLLSPPKCVGTSTTTSRLLAHLQTLLSGQVTLPTHGAVSFDLALPSVLLDRLHNPRVSHKDFMGKAWDIPKVALWREAYRTMRDGAVLMAFAGTRTLDLMAAGIEAAGFKYVGTLAWVHGQGFPKSLNISKAIDKRGGQTIGWFGPWLKEERERRGLTRKELAAHFPSQQKYAGKEASGEPTGCIGNWETGVSLPTVEQFNKLCDVLNLPFTRLEEAEREVLQERKMVQGGGNSYELRMGERREVDANITAPATEQAKQWDGWGTALKPAWEPVLVFTKGPSAWQMPAVPFFYCAKAVKSEKNLDGEVQNNHVTVKPQKLMEWLVSLAAPKGSLILEPFLGSGTTAVAATQQGRNFVGIERDPHYFELASKRVGIVKGRVDEVEGQKALFDLMGSLEDE